MLAKAQGNGYNETLIYSGRKRKTDGVHDFGKTGLHISRIGFGGIPIQKVDAAVTRKLMERLVVARGQLH